MDVKLVVENQSGYMQSCGLSSNGLVEYYVVLMEQSAAYLFKLLTTLTTLRGIHKHQFSLFHVTHILTCECGGELCHGSLVVYSYTTPETTHSQKQKKSLSDQYHPTSPRI